MSAKQWQKTNIETFIAHVNLFDDVKQDILSDHTIYYTVNDTGQQWVGKVTEDGYYIALV